MKNFLVDYENVHEDGLKGIAELAEADSVYIFYTANAASISFDMHKMLNSSKADVKLMNCGAGTKNALDFQLATYLGYLAAGNKSAEYFIVSKDKGFEAVCTFWKEKQISVNSAFDLTGKNAQEENNKLRQEIKKVEPDNAKVNEICEIITALKTKQGINNAFVKKFGNDLAGKLYKAVKPLLKDKK